MYEPYEYVLRKSLVEAIQYVSIKTKKTKKILCMEFYFVILIAI